MSDQLLLFTPESNWQRVEALPDLPAGLTVAVDTETKDNGLAAGLGGGWAWGGGYIAGISFAWPSGALYAPVKHPDSPCFSQQQVAAWLHHQMLQAERVVFHNSMYDLGWLTQWGFNPSDYRIEDTHAMAVMIDENRLSYGLDALCKSYNLPGKNEAKLREAASAFGIDPKSEMWKLPARYVGEYAEDDARATLGLWGKLRPLLDEQEVYEAYRLEMDLVPCLVAMRKQGIRIDELAAERVKNDLRMRTHETLTELRRLAPPTALPRHGDELRSPKYLEQLFDAVGLPYSRTLKTKQGQFESKWLKKHDHRIPQLIASWRALDDLEHKFIDTYILSNAHVGRIHAEIHALRSDDSGTRSYRFSYSNPPLQQMPGRDEDLAPLIRGIFLPEPDDLWLSADYSQQEPRMAVHFAAVAGLPGHEEAVAYYRDNPKADFHTMVAQITGIERKYAKIINLGLMYGMGVAKLASSLGVSEEDAERMVAQYNERMPFVKELTEFCMRRAESRGYIRLLDGARCRWDMWQVGRQSPLPLAQAQERQRRRDPEWRGTLRRAFTHRAMNRLCQGSAARQTKIAMRDCWREKIMPSLQMHDELAFSIGSAAQGARAAQIMKECVTLKIPVYVDAEYGRSWGESMKKYSYEQARALT